MNRRWKTLGLGLAFAALAQHAHAALFDDEEARRRIADTNVRLSDVQRRLEERIAALETQLKSGGLVELANQIELVKQDLAKLRGQIEVITYELAEAQKRQRDLYVDLDSRMRRLETAQANAAAAAAPPTISPPAADPNAPPAVPGAAGTLPPGPTGAAGSPPRADAAAEQRAYDTALDLFKRGDYQGAIAGFGNFVRTYPRTPLASSAQYWIGNAHFARRDYRAALTAQRTLIANYPDSPKVPDALLNIASAQAELGDMAGSRRTLEELVAKHPQSEAAAKARQRLAAR
ncbi:MAG TPA: tol-pal system protein YbgF [Casimicrobiaceae bacterium]|nr:tol-pal system protein YbgF [Casimicrobiaceae bacterium]